MTADKVYQVCFDNKVCFDQAQQHAPLITLCYIPDEPWLTVFPQFAVPILVGAAAEWRPLAGVGQWWVEGGGHGVHACRAGVVHSGQMSGMSRVKTIVTIIDRHGDGGLGIGHQTYLVLGDEVWEVMMVMIIQS